MVKRLQVQNPAGAAGEFSSPGSTFYADQHLFRYPFHLQDTTVAHKRSRSFCQKYMWQVRAIYMHVPDVCGFA